MRSLVNGLRLTALRARLVPVALAASLAACATNPVTGDREFTLMSEAQEIQIGAELDQQVRQQMGLYEDERLQQYVERIGLQLAAASHRPELPWSFAVVDVAAVNAFALPGGYIYLTRGMLAYLADEAELAGVLGHEIGHVTARHAVQQYSRATGATLGLTLGSIFFPQTRPVAGLAETGLGLLFLKYSRDDELQSDRLGAEYAASEGWDPRGVPDMLTTLGRLQEQTDRRGIPNWASTHPQPADRVDEIRPVVNTLTTPPAPSFRVDRNGYLSRIDGVVYGEDPDEGITRGNRFLHRELRFAMEFPEGWTISNQPTQVVSQRPGSDLYVILQLLSQPQGRTLEQVAVNAMRSAGFRRREGAAVRLNGLDAYVGTYEGRVQGLGNVLTRAAHIRHDRTVFVIGGVAEPAAFEANVGTFQASIRSFQPLSAREAGALRPNRLALYDVRPGQTWQSIAQGPGQSNVPASTLAIMNHSPVNEQPRAGDRIKIVVADGRG